MRRVVLISIDNLRADCVGANPRRAALSPFRIRERPKTPHLDRLIAESTYFPTCFTGAPYTTASHATILTGLYPPRHGIREYFRTPLSDTALTLFQRFNSAGWRTVLATDFPALLGPVLGFTRGVDEFIEEQDDAVLAALATDNELPVFCMWHFGTVHNPFGLTSVAYDGEHFETATRCVASLAGVRPPHALQQEWMERRRDDEERLLRQWYFASTDKLYEERRYDELMSLYVEGIAAFDAGRFKRVLDGLARIGFFDDSLLVVTADHGEEYSDRAFAHFNGLCDGIVSVPLLMRGPGVPSARRIDELCRSVDIAPTILDLAGLPGDVGLDGISLRPRIERGNPLAATAFGESMFGYGDEIRRFLAECFAEGRLREAPLLADTHMLYARDRRWKLVVRRDLRTGGEASQLFDVVADPCETRDVSEANPRVVASLRAEIDRHDASASGAEVRLDAAELERLASGLVNIGYLQAR